MLHQFFTFASDAEILGLWGIAFFLLAIFSMVMERRRGKRSRIDNVGWVPWLGLTMGTAIIGAGLMVMAVKGIVAG
ncbi:hypothetical protein [Altererythrobacter aquiaggeris]|uniref:hypothetical protein n=1 Tax=Aestuarierythrobacter aquiaggeris TaxID=1898396 RepID=UPI00301813C6